MKNLFKTVALITFFSFLTRALGFLFRIILSRVVGAEGVGLYQVASSVFMVLLTVISSGIPLVVSRSCAHFSLGKKYEEKSFVTLAVVFTLILSILLSVAVIIAKPVFEKTFENKDCYKILVALLPSLIFSSAYCVLRGVMWGKGNYLALCISESYEQIVRIVVALFLINSSFSALSNALGLAWSMSIACVFSCIMVLLLYFFYGGKMGRAKMKFLSPLIKQSSPISFMRVAGSLMSPLIAIIVPSRLTGLGYTSSQALSLFGVAVGMTMPILFVPTTIIGSLSTALVPDISKAMAQNDINHIEKRIKNSLFFSMFVSCLFLPCFLSLGELSGEFLYNNVLSGTLLSSSSWVLIPLGLTNITSSILNSLGLEHKSFINFVLGAVAMFFALWFLPQIVGINALIWAMGINYIIVSLLNLRLLKKHTKVKLNLLKPFLKMLLISIPCSALTSFVSSLLTFVLPDFLNLLLSGLLCVGSFIILCNVFEVINLELIFVGFKDKIDRKSVV